MIRRHAIAVLVVAGFALGACARDADTFPSLARRPVERISGSAPVVTPTAEATPAPPSPELSSQLDRLLAQARNADARFEQNRERTRALVGAASGAAVASESWSVATVALADLESQRSQAMIALADLDALYAARKVEMGDASAIAAARDAVIAIVAHEDEVLGVLKSGLKS